MQKKELRKSWRRKLAGLLAGTLIAGVFGISMPMTAKAANTGFTVDAQYAAFGDLSEEQIGAATADVIIAHDYELSSSSNAAVTITNIKSNKTDSIFDITTAPSAAVDITNSAFTARLAFNSKALGDSANQIQPTLESDVPYEETFTVTGTYDNDTTDSDDAVTITKTFTASVTYKEDSYDFVVAYKGPSNTDYVDSISGTLNFGELKEGYKGSEATAKKATIQVENTSNVEIDVTFEAQQNSVFTPEGDSGLVAIAPGAAVQMTLTPKAGLGPDTYEENFTFTIDGVQGKTATVKTKLVVKPTETKWEITTPSPAPEKLDFGTTDLAANRVGADGKYTTAANQTKTITVKNSGDTTIENVAAAVDNDAFDVTVSSTGLRSQGTVDVTISPKDEGLTVGNYNTTLTISADGMESFEIPVEFELFAETYTLEVTEKDANNKDVAVTAIAFEERGEGYETALKKDIFVSNKGNTGTGITTKIVDGSGKEVTTFTVSPEDASLTAGAVGTKLTVSTGAISPASQLPKGDYSATLEITNTKDKTKTSIPLTFSVKEHTYSFELVDDKGATVSDLTFESKIENGYAFKAAEELKKIGVKNTGNAPIYVKVTEEVTGTDGFSKITTAVKTAYPAAGQQIKAGATDPSSPIEVLPDLNLSKGTYKTTYKFEAYDKDPNATGTPAPVKKAEKTISFNFVVEKENVAVSITPANYDFDPLPGNFVVGDDVTAKTVTIKNTGNKDVEVGDLTVIGTSGAWKTSVTGNSKFKLADAKGLEGNVLKVGKEATVTIVPVSTPFSTGSRAVNSFDEDLTLTVTRPKIDAISSTGQLEVPAKTATAKINATFSVIEANKSISLGASEVTMSLPEGFTQTEAENAAQEIEIFNDGNITLQVDLSSFVNGTFYKFEKPAENKAEPGESIKVKVWAKTGSTAPQEKEISVNYVGGKAAEAKKLTIKLETTPRKTEAKVTPATLDFGTYNKMKAAPAAKTVTVENTGNGEITLTQPTATMFEIGDLDKTVIQGGEKATFTVVPKADIKAGEQKETITIKGSNGMTDLTVEATVNVIDEGWKKESDGWYYYKDGAAAKGWLKTGGKWYFLDKSTGLMKTGWLKDNGSWYYFKASGAMATNEWVKDGGKYYFFKSGGAMASAQWVSWKGDWYYMNSGGTMKTEGWVKSAGKWYYMGKDGKMVKSTSVTVKGKKYNFDKNGVCTNP